MKDLHDEGVASHNGPESCAGAGNCAREALTGGGTGQVLSREMQINFGAPTPWTEAEGSTGRIAIARCVSGSARSETLSMYPSTTPGSWEIPRPARGGTLVRIGNSKEVQR